MLTQIALALKANVQWPWSTLTPPQDMTASATWLRITAWMAGRLMTLSPSRTVTSQSPSFSASALARAAVWARDPPRGWGADDVQEMRVGYSYD